MITNGLDESRLSGGCVVLQAAPSECPSPDSCCTLLVMLVKDHKLADATDLLFQMHQKGVALSISQMARVLSKFVQPEQASSHSGTTLVQVTSTKSQGFRNVVLRIASWLLSYGCFLRVAGTCHVVIITNTCSELSHSFSIQDWYVPIQHLLAGWHAPSTHCNSIQWEIPLNVMAISHWKLDDCFSAISIWFSTTVWAHIWMCRLWSYLGWTCHWAM